MLPEPRDNAVLAMIFARCWDGGGGSAEGWAAHDSPTRGHLEGGGCDGLEEHRGHGLDSVRNLQQPGPAVRDGRDRWGPGGRSPDPVSGGRGELGVDLAAY